jgi:hypothetical protein
MKRLILSIVIISFFSGAAVFVKPIKTDAAVGKPIKEIVEAVIKKCPVCREFMQSPVGKRLVKSGMVLKHSADDVGNFIKRYGDDGLRLIENHGDQALDIFKKYGDDGVSYLKRYGDDYVKAIKNNDPGSVNAILKHPKGMVFLKESPETVKYFTKYGDDFLTCVNKNPLCIDAIKRTGMSPKTLLKLSDNSVSWFEVNLPKLAKKSSKDANALREILEKYGEPAAKFIREHWGIIVKVGVATTIIVNFDEILAGGQDVLIRTIEKSGDVAVETAKQTVKTTGDTIINTSKGLSSTWKGSFVILGLAGMFLGYRYMLRRKPRD